MAIVIFRTQNRTLSVDIIYAIIPCMKPDKQTLEYYYIKKQYSTRVIGAMLNLDHATVLNYLKKYRIKRRTTAKRSRLIHYSKASIMRGIKELGGIPQFAKKLGIRKQTLYNYLNKIG